MSAFESDKNPMRIPDLTPMYEAVRDFVKEHQGDKGFICTDDNRCDTIWCIVYSEISGTAYEYEVKAVRVKHNTLQVVYDTPGIIYDGDAVMRMSDEEWYDVQFDDNVYFIPTIFNIAENIQEYV